NLFGVGTAMPPAVTIDSPKNGVAVDAAFPVRATVTDANGIAMVELRIDGTLTKTLTASPYAFDAPATLAKGMHTVEVTGYDPTGTSGKAAVDVFLGDPCNVPADCPSETDTCVAGHCVPGPGAMGGLGQPCMTATDCASNQC